MTTKHKDQTSWPKASCKRLFWTSPWLPAKALTFASSHSIRDSFSALPLKEEAGSCRFHCGEQATPHQVCTDVRLPEAWN